MNRRSVGFGVKLQVRAFSDGEDSRTIEGYALKFGVRSLLLSPYYRSFYEVLEVGCVTRALLDKQDIILTMFHNREIILGRSKNGVGTLHYEVDAVGVKFWCEMPKTVDGDRALELVKRGDIAGCSFCYSTDEDDSEHAVSYEKLDEVDEYGDHIYLRHVKRIDHVYDFTLTPSPAYEQTEVNRRELERAGVPGVGLGAQGSGVEVDVRGKLRVLRELRERIAVRV